MCASVCLCACLSPALLKTNDPKTSQSVQTWYREWPWDIRKWYGFWGWKVKGQGHRVTKCQTYWRRSSGRREMCTLSSALQSLVIYHVCYDTDTRFVVASRRGCVASRWSRHDKKHVTPEISSRPQLLRDFRDSVDLIDQADTIGYAGRHCDNSI